MLGWLHHYVNLWFYLNKEGWVIIKTIVNSHRVSMVVYLGLSSLHRKFIIKIGLKLLIIMFR